MAGKSVQASLEKWTRNMQAAGPSVQEGVKGVTESPGVKANAAKDKYVRNVMASANNGTLEEGNNSYTVEEWRQAMLKKGLSNMATGAANLSPRAKRAITEQLQIANEVSQAVAGMPTDTFDAAMAKAKENARLMMERSRRGRRG